MSRLIEVIFTDNSIWGKKDERKFVEYSFSQFLLEKKIALLVTRSNIVDLENKRKEQLKCAQERKEHSRELFQKLNGVSLSFQLKKDKKGGLFSSVSSNEVIKSLKQCGFLVKKEQLVKFKSIRAIGEVPLKIRLSDGIVANIKLIIC